MPFFCFVNALQRFLKLLYNRKHLMSTFCAVDPISEKGSTPNSSCIPDKMASCLTAGNLLPLVLYQISQVELCKLKKLKVRGRLVELALHNRDYL